MKISIIAALSENYVIGKNNDLPWYLPDDMKFFMQTTKTHHVIMGRKNYESLPEKFRPLPNRTNIVVTTQNHFAAPDCHIVHTIEDGLAIARKNNETETFIIGGAEIYKLSFPFCTHLYLTEIKETIEGDVYFPPFDKAEWKEMSRTPHAQDERHSYAFDMVTYQRIYFKS